MNTSAAVKATSPTLSLEDLLGRSYVQSVIDARAFLSQKARSALYKNATEKVDFFPQAFQARINDLLECVGERVSEPLVDSVAGAGTLSFNRATNLNASPLSGMGFLRIGEDGRVYLSAKSEHYHASLGHAFPGYRLIEIAHALGILNVTHNNTRGYITRLLEQELVRMANGIARHDVQGLQAVLASQEPHVLNRVINLETGSLAVEAALKMMLVRFYRQDESVPLPRYADRIPVFLVMADRTGGKKANYHGTTIFTQFMRGLWPELYERMEEHQMMLVRPVNINDSEHFEETLRKYEKAPYKVAGFFHEIVLMNYGGILLTKEYLQRAYALCHQHDVPVCVDEIQSCIWAKEAFLYREYGLDPDFVTIGKGFPGGEYPASRVLATTEMDTLSQFGALVTNGQEELASLAYLITMEFLQANSDYVEAVGKYYEEKLHSLAKQYPGLILQIEGYRHLSTIFFHQAEDALKFITRLNQDGIDISAQTYKADCPPAALTKLPLVSSYKMVDYLVERMEYAAREIS